MAVPSHSRLVTALGGVLLALGAAVAIVPRFTECSSPTAMCRSTARWEIVVGAAIAVLAVLVIVTPRRVRQAAALGAAALAVLSILLPTSITGVCSDPMMHCRKYLEPTSILLGVVALVVSLVVFGLVTLSGKRPAGPERFAE